MIGKETAELMVTVAGKLGPEYYRAFRAAMDGDPRAAVELAVLTLNDYRPAEWLALPAQLPPTEKEQRALLLSVAEVDARLRSDLRRWARENRDLGDLAGKALQTLARAYWGAYEILQDEDLVDPQLALWRDKLARAVRDGWAVDVGEAPRDPCEDERWAMRVAQGGNPAPGWLLAGDHARTFAPQPTTASGRPDYPRTSKRHGGDDD